MIDDEILQSDGNHWTWSPRFYAGQVHAELLGPGDRTRATYLLDVSPDPEKLGRDTFQAMLERIWAFDPRLVLGTEPAAVPIGHEAATAKPWLEYARLRAYGDRFVRALAAIAHWPLRELRAERAHLPLPQVRRADRHTALAALGNPQLLKVLHAGEGAATSTGAMPRFDVPVARETLDGAANRCIAAIAHEVSRRAVRLRDELQTIVEKESDSATRTSLGARWPRRREFLDRLVAQLRHFLCIPPLVDVKRHEISAAGLNAVSADPAYSNAYGSGWRILRRGAEGPPRAERMWISPTWEIYERWCFVQLCDAVRKAKPEYSWSVLRTNRWKATAALTGSGNGHRSIELLLQPKFPAGDQRPNIGFRSVSGSREPDIVLTRTEGDMRKWHVLDAKYRTGRSNVLEAMASAHIYRDALRWNGHRPESAVLLVPRAGDAEWLERPEFIERHRVGVCALGAEADLQVVTDLLFADTAVR
ncbi:MAG: hypothetical protein F4X81_11570 [Gammaproteobacteria bacterium]|nr:hypothetical protein [Gammaproteobacteria bacterium]MYH16062.1 hypothetical protein [Gammaproteobacteria bacterium]